jgi:predicted enzyme related to lactoylglutathione lyase
MDIKKFGLAWVMASDIKKSKEFFTQKLGLNVTDDSTEYGWMELKAQEGDFLFGVGQCSEDFSPVKPGQNAVLTMTVEDIVAAKAELEAKQVNVVGDIVEVPGHVKMLFFTDADGNYYQLVQELSSCC